MINWMKYRWLYLFISGTVILSGMFSILKWGLPLGVEFKGGTLVEYKLDKNIDSSKIENIVKQNGVEVVSIQKTQTGSYLLKLGQETPTQKDNVKTGIEKLGI